MHVLWLITCRANMLASCKKHLPRYSCASLVPLGMKWACVCAGKKNALGVGWCNVSVLCVLCDVVYCHCNHMTLLVAPMLASTRWPLIGEKIRVQKKTISVIAHKLRRRGFISVTVLIDSKNKVRKKIRWLRFL